jgi:hypothetical protein
MVPAARLDPALRLLVAVALQFYRPNVALSRRLLSPLGAIAVRNFVDHSSTRVWRSPPSS